MQQVMILGIYRHKTAQATFRRSGKHWMATVVVGGKSLRESLTNNNKPCWSVALKLFDKLVVEGPAKRKKPMLPRSIPRNVLTLRLHKGDGVNG